MLNNSDYKWTAFVPPVITGVLAATITCIIKKFFIFYNYTVTSSFLRYFLYITARDSLIPLIAISLLFFLLSKDDWDYKTSSIQMLALSFFSVYIPYFTISGKEAFSIFLSIIKPMIFISLSAILSISAKALFNAIRNKNSSFIALTIFCILVAIILPAIAQTLWYYNISTIICIIISTLYIIMPISLNLFKRIQCK